MDPLFIVPASPGTPLYPVSPERINQLRIPASPSLPNDLANLESKHIHSRTSSDVQSKVTFLNNLSRANSLATASGGTTAALQRAILGREEAESALSIVTAQLGEAQARERKISERVESLMEDLQSVKERQAHERQVYEKEVRKARKDAFRAGSALVKLQEDLKDARRTMSGLRDEVQKEKFEKEKSKQESFERAYTLAGLMEEMETLREKMRAVESEREAERLNRRATALQEEAGSESQAKLKKDDEDFWAPKAQKSEEVLNRNKGKSQGKSQFTHRKPLEADPHTPVITWGLRRQHRRDSFKENEDPSDVLSDSEDEFEDLSAELQWERKLRLRAEDMVHFLQIECQFKRCSCRLAESQGRRYVCDWEWENRMRIESVECKRITAEQDGQSAGKLEDKVTNNSEEPNDICHDPPSEDHEQSHSASAQTLAFSPGTGTFHNVSSAEPREVSEHESTARPHSQASALSPPKLAARLVSEDITIQSPIRQVPPTPPASATPPSSTPTDDPPIDPPKFTEQESCDDLNSSTTPKSIQLVSPSVSPSPTTPTFKTPSRPLPRTVHAQTTTVMVPLRGGTGNDEDNDIFGPMPGTPVSREQALAQIRARRDRARSVTRVRSVAVPGSARRAGGGLREVSATSAPGRI